jgi:hypothetical protein
MKLFIGIFGVLLISFKVGALPKASDFKEVGADEQEISSGENNKSLQKEEEAEKPKLEENEEILSGTVRVIRKIEMTEVFFKDIKDSYYIPSGSKYSSIYKALNESMKKGTQVSFKANTKSRRVISLESAPVKSPANGLDAKSTTPSGGSK